MMRWRTIGMMLAAGGLIASTPGPAIGQLSAQVQLFWHWGDDGGWRAQPVSPAVAVAYQAIPARVRRVAVPRIRVPPGHLPPQGLCRLWYPCRPPGHQPPPAPCGTLFRTYRQPGVAILGAPGWAPAYLDFVDTHPGRGRGKEQRPRRLR